MALLWWRCCVRLWDKQMVITTKYFSFFISFFFFLLTLSIVLWKTLRGCDVGTSHRSFNICMLVTVFFFFFVFFFFVTFFLCVSPSFQSLNSSSVRLCVRFFPCLLLSLNYKHSSSYKRIIRTYVKNNKKKALYNMKMSNSDTWVQCCYFIFIIIILFFSSLF